jgi:hypothetical protein
LHYLSGSITFDPTVTTVDALLASKIVWLDCLLLNVDRTCRNTNMLIWYKELWLIDHGAALYFHHSWHAYKEKALLPFANAKDHVLLPQASDLDAVDKSFSALLTNEVITSIVSLIPDEWLEAESIFESADQHRQAYIDFLTTRVAHSGNFVKAAQDARAALI